MKLYFSWVKRDMHRIQISRSRSAVVRVAQSKRAECCPSSPFRVHRQLAPTDSDSSLRRRQSHLSSQKPTATSEGIISDSATTFTPSVFKLG